MKPQASFSFCEVNFYVAAPVLGMLNLPDFEIAQSQTKLFASWRDHTDFVQERESAWFGLATAGTEAELQIVPYAAFVMWGRLTGAPCDIASFDIFASHWTRRSRSPGSTVKGVLFGDDSENFDRVGQCPIRIAPECFSNWLSTLSRLPTFGGKLPNIDDYATLVVECCIDGPLSQAER